MEEYQEGVNGRIYQYLADKDVTQGANVHTNILKQS